MTFGNYILRLRRRLQDFRTVAGVNITTLSQDGARWTTSELVEICNDVFDQVILLLRSNMQSQIYQQLGEDFFIFHTTGTTDSTGKSAMVANALAILTLDVNNKPYTLIHPAEYVRYKDKGVLPTFAETFYTVVQNVSTKVRNILIIPEEVVTFSISAIYSKTDYVIADINQELHLQGINWLLMDMAEKECRDREHNWERSKILDERIKFNLGIKNG